MLTSPHGRAMCQPGRVTDFTGRGMRHEGARWGSPSHLVNRVRWEARGRLREPRCRPMTAPGSSQWRFPQPRGTLNDQPAAPSREVTLVLTKTEGEPRAVARSGAVRLVGGD